MKKSKLESKIRRYVELSKKFQLNPKEVSNNEIESVLDYSNITLHLTAFPSMPDSHTQTKSEHDLILEKIDERYSEELKVVNEWFEYLALQNELVDIK